MFDRTNRYGFFKVILASLITSFIVCILFLLFTSGNVPWGIPRTGLPSPGPGVGEGTPQPQQIAAESTGSTSSITNVAKSASQGVVGISVLRVDTASIFDKNTAEKWGIGSGVIVSPNGYILTNHHVAGGKSKRLVVSLADGRNVDGVTLWSDPVLDIAIVKVNLAGLTPIPLGDANTLQVGEPAIAIGNPLGLELQRTVTSGIISALNRTIRIETEQGINYMEDLIQTDASINPGNSGGPLLNSKGQVVGINTIKVASAEAIGFAIPINVAIPIIKKFDEKGAFDEPYMGVFAYDKEVMPVIDGNLKLDSGVYVVNVDKEGPAFKAGIDVGCIIKQVDGVDINTMIQLRTIIYSKNPGDIINITHIDKRTGNTVTVPLKLAAKDRDGLLTR
ncbi:MAG: trypsin-like peptidase domain-containing protein [Firmicutes bacterium]|nr:trypsin-like peptidase domain-containing protein [Bacillota bacterium]